jgi:hypothetical protein
VTQASLFAPRLPDPSCVLSADGGGADGLGSYRYSLRLPIAPKSGVLLFVMANPSTARVIDGKFTSDPTITRCLGFARAWDYGTLLIGNVRAWRETDPAKVPSDPLAVGPENDAWLQRMADEAHHVVCGWGKLAGPRGPAVLKLIRDAGKVPHALKVLGGGEPGHPLYLPANLEPVPMTGDAHG